MQSVKSILAISAATLLGFVLVSLLPVEAATDNVLTDNAATDNAADQAAPAKPVTAQATAKVQLNAKVQVGAKAQAVAVKQGDWPMWGGDNKRNNTPDATGIPTDWDVGGFDRQTGEWKKDEAKNIKWVARLGSQSYGNPVVADGRVYVGTNNGAGYIKRYPEDVDLGCLLCFDEKDGSFLWQHSSEKLATGRVHDWPLQGICCAPLVEGKRLWFVSSRGLVLCLDTEGFRDNEENDGPFTTERVVGEREADVIWEFDMMGELKVSQHNMCSCSVAAIGDILFVNTSNGVDNGHILLPSPEAPTFVALDKNTGKVLWTDKSPGENILHGQWSSPTIAELGGVPQVIFAGGDGWVYSFKADAGKDGKPELLWKFDANPKTTKWILGGRGTRNNIIATPVIYNDNVYVAVGQDPEHGEGVGHLWCIDPTKRGDVSPQLAVAKADPTKSIPHRRLQAVLEDQGEMAIENPNSAVIWHYSEVDQDGNGRIDFEETMHRSCGTVAIKNDLLYISDFSGLLHCLDAKTGKVHWTYDMLAEAWGSPLIVDGHVYIGDADGDVAIFNLSAEPHDPLEEVNMDNAVFSTPIVANGVLFIANRTHLFAISKDGK